jgi:flagellin
VRINHNLSALNAWKNMTVNDTGQNKSLEKLSSGLRIGRAADDAAGLSISEKMRGQISGLNQASRNAQDGISLLQTAEGALQETHSILQRMRELAVQSASDTVTVDDRGEIQKEIDALRQEIDRIANTTQFNTKNLLDGSFAGKIHIGANAGQNMDVSIAAMDAAALNVNGVDSIEASALTDQSLIATAAGGETLTVDGTYMGTQDASISASSGADAAVTVTIAYADLTEATHTFDADNTDPWTVDGLTFTVTNVAEVATDTAFAAAVDVIAGVEAKGIDVSTQALADQAISTIDSAIVDVSGQRSQLGAIQNRLEHTIANLATSSENLTAAESRIRDVDIAVEMMNFTKYQILAQASTAMLAQANAKPQAVLQLLR